MYTVKEERLWNKFLSGAAVLLSLMLPMLVVAEPVGAQNITYPMGNIKSVVEHSQIMDMNKISPKADLVVSAKCSLVLKNIDGYICYSYKDKSAKFSIYAIDKRVNEVNLKKRLDFKADKRIPKIYRNPIKCFKHTGYDLGHLEPDADEDFSKTTLYHTYLMSNVVPQPSFINRNIIANWENFERDLTITGTVVMITGADYYRTRYFNNPHCSKLPKDYYKVYFVYNNVTKRYEPFLVLYTKNNTKHITYKIRNGRFIRNFLKRRGIYFYNKK